MNIAVIFAGGTGQRMNSRTRPKQFLELHGKPILVYTIEKFQEHEEIDGIVLATLETWVGYCNRLKEKYHLTKLCAIVPGGKTAAESTFKGLEKAEEMFPSDSIVLIHDGVRPLIDDETIHRNIECVKQYGTAITVTPAIETIAILSGDRAEKEIDRMVERSKCQMAKAPQCFYLGDILNVYRRMWQSGKPAFIDSATMMVYYGYKLYAVEGIDENIQITTPYDFYMFRAFIDAKENSQIFGW